MSFASILCAVSLFAVLLSPSSCPALCVKTATANLRSGPGTRYEKVWEVYRFMPLRKVGESLSGDWYAVRDVDGDVNWIHRTLVTEGYRCAVVKAEVVNVRTGPGTGYPKKFSEPARRYSSYKILGTRGVWVKVKDEWNDVGWIHRKFLWSD